MRKATLILSALSFATSATTLAVVLGGAKKVQKDMAELRSKTNDTIGKLKVALLDLSV